MSQQEFVSPSESQRSQGKDASNDDEAYYPQHPYSWSPNKASAPRDEPPSSYDEPMMQRGYQAQDSSADSKSQESTTRRSGRQQARQQFGPDGDAYERGYRMSQQYNVTQGVPPWARPQRRPRYLVRLVVLIVLGLIFMGPILHLLGGLLLLVIGAVFFSLLLALFVLVIVSIIFILRLPFRRRSSFPPWHGPWGW